MFDDLDTDIGDESGSNPAKKFKQKQVEMKTEVVHSSLSYNTIKVPPLLEYKSINSYCESKLLTSCDPAETSVPRISTPVVFRTPKPPRSNTPALNNESHPFCSFSIEELSLVKALDNWTNKKVCAVGELNYICDAKDCVLNSVGESGSWNISLDVSSLKANPEPQKLMQVYGILNVTEGKPKINVRFVRNLGTVDLLLFAESYKLMQEYIPKSINVKKVLHEEKS